ncbi:MAG: hypothetical protein NTY65_15930 [Planctomycetota bacterium]|nr:hypothetical protein [Planctomycetota bacterium]
MCAQENPDNLAALLKTGYGAPPPREEFVRDLGRRMCMAYDEQHMTPAAPEPQRVSVIRWSWAAAAAAAVVLLTAGGITWTLTHPGVETHTPPTLGSVAPPEPSGTPQEQLVPLEIKLPKAVAGPTPKNIKPSPYLEPYSDKQRPAFSVPEGTTNVALGKPVTSGESTPILGELKQITDGDKEGLDGSYVDLGNNTQWVQIDLKEPCAIYAVVIWHYHIEKRVYHDVVVQVADDPDFIENVRTVYNNDFDNSSGLGVGKDLEYIEDYRGRLIDAKGVTGRYVRLYSRGNSSDELNHYTEVEVYGKPAGPAAVPAATKAK